MVMSADTKIILVYIIYY